MANAQDPNERIGIDEILKTGLHYYNYADKDKVNIEVSMWGYIKSPGKYLIPNGTTLLDIITLGGGPNTDAILNDIRIIRLKNDSLGIKKDTIFVFDYNDFLWEEKIKKVNRINPVLYPGDIVLIPGEPRFFFKDNLAIILSIASTLISLAILVTTIINLTR